MKKEKILSVIMIAALLMQLTAYASEDDNPTKKEHLAEVLAGEAVKMVAKIGIALAANDLFDFLAGMTFHLREFIMANPPLEDIKGVQGFFIFLMSPFFTLGIVLTSAYLLLYSESPRGRAKAKGVLARLIYALILVSLSPLIIELLLTMSAGITGIILDHTDVDFAGAMVYEGSAHMFWIFRNLTLIQRTGGVELLLLWETFLMIANFVIAMRYLLVILWSILFPVSLLLFSFTPTKRIGKKFMHQTFLWTFVQVGWAIAVLLINASVKGMDEVMPGYPTAKIGITCIFLFLAAPRVVFGLMDWLSLGVEVVEIVNIAPLSMGALTMDEMKVERAVIVEEPALDGI
jgi:hypothetical protein